MRLFDWVRSVMSRVRRGRFDRHRRRQRPSRFVAELLESRQLPSAVTFTGTMSQQGVLRIDLAEASASTLSISSTVITSASGPVDVVRVAINGSWVNIRQASSQSLLSNLPAAMVGRIVVTADNNANTLDLSGVSAAFGLQQAAELNGLRQWPSTNVAANSLATASFFGLLIDVEGGDDRVVGSPFNDFIAAGQGRDTVLGQAGDDELLGEAGNDILFGSLGDDRLNGGDDGDVVVGSYGGDALTGGNGNDVLIGGAVNFADGQIAGLMDLRDRWLATALNEEMRRQTIAPWSTTLVGVDDNRDNVIDRDAQGRPKDALATSTRIAVPQSMADAFDPDNYGSSQPSGLNFLARLGGQKVRVVSRIVTADPDSDLLVIEPIVGASAVSHEVGEALVVQAQTNFSPLDANSLWANPIGTEITQTLFDDFAANTLTGSAGNDFFVVSDELLSFHDLGGDPRLAANDVLTDIGSEDGRYRAVNASADSKRMAVPITTIEPAFGEALAVYRGTVTNLGGAPGTSVLTTNRIGDIADDPRLWGGLIRTAYVTNPAFNVTSDLVHLGSFPAINGGPNELSQTRWDYLLSTAQLDQPHSGITPVTPDFVSRVWRWSQNPLEPDVEYAFVAGVGPNGQSSGVQKYRFLSATDDDDPSGMEQLYEHANQTLAFTSFDPLKLGGLPFLSKGTLFFNAETGHNYTVLFGNPRRADLPNEFDRTVVNAYVIDLDVAALPNTPSNANKWADPVIASFTLTAATGTAGYPYGSQPENVDDFYVSPDGRQIMVVYQNEVGVAYRLLDVDLSNREITPHIMPVTPAADEDIAVLRRDDVRQNGFFPFRWHHATFALGASGKSYVVGQPGKWSRDNLVSPNIQYLAGSNVIGQLLRFDPVANKFASLTNPAFENITPSRETLSHVTANNTQNPGYVFVSYYSGTDPFTDSSPAYKGAIVAVNIEQPTGPDGAIVLARHQTQSSDQYAAQPMINVSTDGTRVLFQSTWGEYQQSVSTYQITPGSRVEIVAAGSVVLRRTSNTSVALFADTTATTPIDGTQRTISPFDMVIVRAASGQSLRLTLDFSAGTPVPSGGVLQFDGESSNGDQLKLLNTGSGGAWDWTMTGNGVGQLRGPSSGLIRFNNVDSFSGGDGNDVFHLSANSEWQGVLSGGAGSDTLDFATFTTSVSASLVDGSVTFASASGMLSGQTSQFENIVGGSGNDQLMGDSAANVLRGGAGNDTIRAGGGTDFVDGGRGDDALWGQNDADSLTGGLGNDSLDGGSGDDVLIESGNGNAVLATTSLIGFAGVDSLNGIELARLTGGTGDNVLNATDFVGSVTLLGGDGNDTLLDAAGDDSLSGGAGDDMLKLSARGSDLVNEATGDDWLDYSAALGALNIDLARTTRQDVRTGHRLTLSAGFEYFVGSSFADVVTMTVAGALIRNVDGLTTDATTSDMLRVLGTTNSWVLNSVMSGHVENGFSATPIRFANFGSVQGGDGNDSFVLTGSRFQGTLSGGAGDNTLDLSRLTAGQSVSLSSNDSTGFAGSVRSANSAATSPTTNFRGIDSIIGTDQNDTLIGAATDATWDVLAELYSDSASGRRLRFDAIEALVGGDLRDLFVNVQPASPITLGGGAGDDTLDASQSNVPVTLLGGDGNDELRGGSNGDLLDGGNGDDTLIGGSGVDELLGGAGRDLFDDSISQSNINGGADSDSLQLIGTWTLASASSRQVLNDIEIIVGSGPTDVLSGSTSAESFAIGSDGVRIDGSGLLFQGFETINGGTGNGDSISGTAVDDTFFVSPSSVSAFGSQLLGFEKYFGGGGSDRLQGSDSLNEVFNLTTDGVTINNMTAKFSEFEILDGGSGNDTIIGPSVAGGLRTRWTVEDTNTGSVAGFSFAGIETLRGGTGEDVFVMQPNGQVSRIDGGGSGRDGLDYSAFSTAIHVHLTNLQATNVSSIAAINSVIGGSGDDAIVGSSTGDWLDGGSGNDTLDGLAGDDSLSGGLGDDLLFGATGSGDIVVESRDANIVIGSGEISFDGRLEDQMFGIERMRITGGDSANELDARRFSGSVTLLGSDGNDTLFGGLGADSLGGGNGDDVLVGGAGADTLDGNDGRDILEDDLLNNMLQGGSGDDALRMTGSWTISTAGLPKNVTNIESVIGAGLSDSLAGSSLAEKFSVTDSGMISVGSSLVSFSGFEFVLAGSGRVVDSLLGSTADDVFVLSTPGGVRFRGVTFTGVEMIDGLSGNDRLCGAEANAESFQVGVSGVTVTQWTGMNFVGFESLDGGGGSTNDSLMSTLGNDVFELRSSGSVALGGLNLRGFEVLNGGTGNDRVQGQDSVAETFVSSPTGIGVTGWTGLQFQGIESLVGGEGLEADTLSGGTGNDLFTAEPNGMVKANGVAFVGFEFITGGDGTDRLAGSATLADTFQVTTFGVQVVGVAELNFTNFETLVGGGGNDVLQVTGGATFDGTFDGGAGIDAVDFGLSATTRNVILTGSGATGFSGRETTSGMAFIAVESVKGGSGTDSLTGLNLKSTWNIGAKTYTDASLTTLRVLKWDGFENFNGGSANDTFNNVTGTTAVTLSGGTGDDLLDASAATVSVTLLGGAGNDVLKGGRGADSLAGGLGDDILIGNNSDVLQQ